MLLKRKENIFIIIFIVLMTIIFRFTNLDIDIQKIFYKYGKWYLKDFWIFKFLYNYGPVLAIISGFISLFGLISLNFSDKYRKYKKTFLFIFLSILIGPGIIVNGIFKEYMGRPRPRNVIEFGGTEKFLPVWKIGEFIPKEKNEKMLESEEGAVEWDALRVLNKIKGKHNSFPAGHASIGFFMIFPYFLLINKNKKKANISLILGILYGFSMGIARNAQGGHFPSDVLWAFAFVYIVDLILYHILKIGSEKNENTI